MTRKQGDPPATGVPESSGRERRPYAKPRLARLGTLTDITMTVANGKGKNDMGARPFNKTS